MLLVWIFVTMLIASFDGVVLSTVISKVTSFSQTSSLASVLRFSFISLLAYILIMASGQINTFLRNDLLYRLNLDIKGTYIQNKLAQSDSSSNTDDIISFMLNDFKLVEANYLNLLLDVLSMIIMGIVSMGYLLYLNPLIALIFIVFSFLPMLPPKLMSQQIEQKSVEWSQDNEAFTGALKTIFSGRRIIKTYDAYHFANHHMAQSLHEAEQTNKAFKNSQSIVGFYSAILSWVSYIVPITCALILVIHNKLEAGAVVAMFLASDRVIYPLRNVSMLMNQMNTTKEARKKIFEILETTPNSQAGPNCKRPDVVFDQVDFAYDDKVIFQDLNHVFEFGKKYLITGASGSGKTTMLDLIQGICQPSQGNLYLKEGDKVLKGNFNHLISRINQAPYLFQTTIRNNLALGQSIADERLNEVLNLVGLTKEFGPNFLDLSYDPKTMDLSGGQKQRLEIARAILHQKPILLVDEATSALDKDNALNIRQLLTSLDSTVIEVAHHYSQEELQANHIECLTLEGKKMVKVQS